MMHEPRLVLRKAPDQGVAVVIERSDGSAVAVELPYEDFMKWLHKSELAVTIWAAGRG